MLTTIEAVKKGVNAFQEVGDDIVTEWIEDAELEVINTYHFPEAYQEKATRYLARHYGLTSLLSDVQSSTSTIKSATVGAISTTYAEASTTGKDGFLSTLWGEKFQTLLDAVGENVSKVGLWVV